MLERPLPIKGPTKIWKLLFPLGVNQLDLPVLDQVLFEQTVSNLNPGRSGNSSNEQVFHPFEVRSCQDVGVTTGPANQTKKPPLQIQSKLYLPR